MSVERDGLPDAKALHYDEPQGVAERVRLVHVRAQEGDGAFFVALPNAFDVIASSPTMSRKAKALCRPSCDRTSGSECISTTTAFVVTRRQRSAFARENKDRAWS